MDTTAAAAQAGVTVATIRTWCRLGAVTATKQAGRWTLSPSCLARRIAIGARKRPNRQETPVIDLDATYTYTRVGDTAPITITPEIRHKVAPDGAQRIIVRGLEPLLADKIDAITSEGDRLEALTVLGIASIVISSAERSIAPGMASTRDNGRLATTYRGTRHLPVDTVLDLAEQLRAQLTA